METINFLAQLWGFSLVVIPLALLIKEKYVEYLFKIGEDRKNLFIIGVVNIIIGALLILFYNSWVFNWAAIVTILGWLVFIKGVLVLFFPNAALKILAELKKKAEWLKFVFLFFVLLGCFLIYSGFTH